MKTRRLWVLALMAALLLPLAASAQDEEMGPKPLTWISYLMSQPGKASALTQNLATDGAKIYDGLMADGHVISWGVGMPVNHYAGDDWNVFEWVTFRDWAALDTFMQAFMGMQMAKSPEQMLAEQEEWLSLVVPGSHYDEIVRQMVVARSAGPPPGYFSLTWVPVNPDQGQTLEKLWVREVQPTMTRLQTAGKIGSFGLAASEVHDGSGSHFLFWTALPNLAARDAVDAGMAADAKARGEEAQKAMMMDLYGAADFSAHHDRIILVTHNGGASGGDGE